MIRVLLLATALCATMSVTASAQYWYSPSDHTFGASYAYPTPQMTRQVYMVPRHARCGSLLWDDLHRCPHCQQVHCRCAKCRNQGYHLQTLGRYPSLDRAAPVPAANKNQPEPAPPQPTASGSGSARRPLFRSSRR